MKGSISSTTVVPHQLCGNCQRVAAVYTPDLSWRREMFFDGMTTEQVEKLREAYEATAGLEPLDNTPDIVLYWRSKEPIQHYGDLVRLEQSAGDGCHLCALFVGLERRSHNKKLSAMISPESSGSERQLYVAPIRRSRNSPGCICIALGLFDAYPGMVASEYRTGNKLQALSVISMHHHPRRLSSTESSSGHVSVLQIEITNQKLESQFRWCKSTTAQVGYGLVSSWLQSCLEHHPRCGNSIGAERPKRLLDLEAYTDDIRLVLERDSSAQTYATLSYRWGSAAAVTLTHETHEAFFKRIELRSLPKTIQDTIQYCRGLSLRYLWVDALCIIQGDAQDFNEEISRMGAIYSNSLLTLAAAGSIDSQAGLHRPRYPLYREDCLAWQDDEHLVFFADTSFACSPSLHRRDTLTLDSRAWAFQERMMAPRTLRFTGDDLVWECRETQMCQRCTDDAVRSPQISVRTKALNYKEVFSSLQQDLGGDPSAFLRLHGLKTALRDSSIRFRFHIFWKRILEDFNLTNLSYDDDKLCALAGIAEFPRRQLGYEASFGLWHPFPRDELLWCANSRRYNSLERFPSWSWVGIDGAVRSLMGRSLRLHELLPQTTVRSASILRFPTATPFARMTELYAKFPQATSFEIRTWLASCRPIPCRQKRPGDFEWTLIPVEEDADSRMNDFAKAACQAYRGHLSGNNSVAVFKQLGFDAKPELEPLRRIAYFPDVEMDPTQDLVCCLVKRVIYHDNYEGRGTGASVLVDYGIVLEPVEANYARYRRKGVFKEEIRCNDIGCTMLHEMDHDERHIHGTSDEHSMLKLLGEHLVIFRERRSEAVIELI
ncbi:hypothetical protein NUW58_g6476 [Xylaria curta]|uniref:Uncharacterized protein n=1 Tax=Xylaria curta TaxID=42375 RepID=A0ACC1NTP0_9PEZI|nr:hypothetical protein NUW58_g6476 [Xylaria curta]